MIYLATYRKDPDAIIPCTVSWERMIGHGDTITSASSTAYSEGALTTALVVDSTTNTGMTTTTVLSGGVDGTDYTVIVHVITDDGYEDERTILVKCRQR